MMIHFLLNDNFSHIKVYDSISVIKSGIIIFVSDEQSLNHDLITFIDELNGVCFND